MMTDHLRFRIHQHLCRMNMIELRAFAEAAFALLCAQPRVWRWWTEYLDCPLVLE